MDFKVKVDLGALRELFISHEAQVSRLRDEATKAMRERREASIEHQHEQADMRRELQALQDRLAAAERAAPPPVVLTPARQAFNLYVTLEGVAPLFLTSKDWVTPSNHTLKFLERSASLLYLLDELAPGGPEDLDKVGG